jgi:hypothetical protein
MNANGTNGRNETNPRNVTSRFRLVAAAATDRFKISRAFSQRKIYIFFILSEFFGGAQIRSCKIWGFHGGDFEEWCLLGCYAVWLL